MITLLIVVLLIVGILLALSVVLGRQSEEVESARDTEYLELDGTWIRYNVVGGGPPVLLVHGWLSSSRVWDGLAGRLAQRFTVYTLDLTGFGESDKPLSGYGVRNGSRLLYAFCAHFGLTRTGVVAHDLGGNMAVKLAADHPDVVGSLILVAVPADEEQIDLPTPLWLATLPVVGPLFYALGKAVRPVRAMWMKPFVSEPEDLPEEVLDDAASSTPAAMRSSLGTTRREISGGRLARQARIIKGPMLLIAGEEDQIVDPQSVGTWARIADNAEVTLIEECGHLPMLERTGEFNAHVLAFLTGDARYLDLIERPPSRDVLPEDEDSNDQERDEYADNEYADDEYAEDEYADTTDDEPRYTNEPAPTGRRTDFEDDPARYDDTEDFDEPLSNEPVRDERPLYDRGYERRRPARGESFEPEDDEDQTRDLSPSSENDDVPNVVRKRHGSYSSRREPEESLDNAFDGEDDSGNGSERRDEPRARRERTEREPLEGGPIPELPKELFDWTGGFEEFQPRARRRSRPEDREAPDENENGTNDPPESPRSP